MTANELQAMLRERYGKENEAVEWKAASNLRHFVSGSEGEDLVSYVSAFANMDGGAVVMGVKDKTLAVSGIAHFGGFTPENLSHRLQGHLTHLPSLGLHVEEFVASDTNAKVWVVRVPKHSPRKPVIAHKKAWQRDGDSLVELREDRHAAILAEPLAGEDWSAVVVAGATLDDLDADAVALARRKYTDRHQGERWAGDIAGWTNAQFFDKARITRDGGLTRAALLLLGRPECVALLSPNPAEISWKLPDERVIEHFGPPFLLTTTEVLKRIRNPNIKLFPATQLIATEMPRYDTQVVLESLHNCIAHQDYSRNGRVVVEEVVGRLKMTNVGGFVDGAPEDYFDGSRVPNVYRNPWLAAAMNAIAMIDKGGFGIAEMLRTQRKRYLPLPDYQGSTLNATMLNIYGQSIDENYSRLLMEQTDLPIEQVVWLDRIQKKLRVDDAHVAELRSHGLIEGRKPNWTVSASVAQATRTENAYVLNSAFDDEHYKALLIRRLKLGPASGAQLRELLFEKLPGVLNVAAKETKIKNLRTALRLRGHGGTYIEVDPAGPLRGPGAIWRIRR